MWHEGFTPFTLTVNRQRVKGQKCSGLSVRINTEEDIINEKGTKSHGEQENSRKLKRKNTNSTLLKKIKSFKKFLPVKPSVSPSETKSFAGRNFSETVLQKKLLPDTFTGPGQYKPQIQIQLNKVSFR